jgi:hypothetical protein
MCRIRFVVVALTVGLALPAVAAAQDPPLEDVFNVNYFDNANTDLPDATVRITNTGATFADVPLEGALCAMIYVFRPDQQLAACCGCKLTHNALLKLSVNNNLTNNPLTADPLTSGTFKIISALPTDPTLHPAPSGSSPQCNPGVGYVPAPELKAWSTHWNDGSPFLGPLITETAFEEAQLSATELGFNQLFCELIESSLIPPGFGSGRGTCTCPEEGNGT